MTRRFNGFLVQTDPAVGMPRAFFTDVLPQLTEMAELQATLAIFRLASEAGGIESPVSEVTLLADRSLRAALRTTGSPREPDERIADRAGAGDRARHPAPLRGGARGTQRGLVLCQHPREPGARRGDGQRGGRSPARHCGGTISRRR